VIKIQCYIKASAWDWDGTAAAEYRITPIAIASSPSDCGPGKRKRLRLCTSERLARSIAHQKAVRQLRHHFGV